MGSNTVGFVICFLMLLLVVGCKRSGGEKPHFDNSAGSGEMAPLKDADAYAARAYEWLCKGDCGSALKDYSEAIRLEPKNAAWWNGRGFTWHMKGIGARDRAECEDRALADYDAAIRLDPGYASAINNRAWLRATTKIDRCRNGHQAVEEAKKACELTGWKNAGYLDTLSVAFAEVGDFEQAVRWQKKALEDASYEREERDNSRKKLAQYRKKRPFRE